MQQLTTSELKEKINNKENFVLDLYATWCGPCKVMLYYIQDEKFDTVKIKKTCKNGVELNSDSNWGNNGRLHWVEKKINQNESSYGFIENFF